MAKLLLLCFFSSVLFMAHVHGELEACGAARYDPTKVSIFYHTIKHDAGLEAATSILVSPAISYARSLAVKSTFPAVVLATVRPVIRTMLLPHHRWNLVINALSDASMVT